MNHSRVLIVEDDRAILLGLKDSFSKKRFTVQVAMDGEEAIEVALSDNFDLILLDIMLPKFNGFEICTRIREAEIDCPIVMLTARGEEEHIIRGLNLGADDYVVKPFSAKQLHARCEAIMRRHKKSHIDNYTFGKFTLNIQSKQLTHEELGNIRLTPKEYGLLAYFLKKDNHALTREMLLNAVWHSSVMTTVRSIDRCVNTLRNKIEDNPRQPKFIISIRNVGYRFSSCHSCHI